MNKLVILIIIAVLGIGAYMFLGGSSDENESALGSRNGADSEDTLEAPDLEETMKSDDDDTEMKEKDGEEMMEGDHSDDGMMEGEMKEDEKMMEDEDAAMKTEANASGFADGTYNTEVTYNAPKGNVENFSVELTLTDGVVTEVTNTFEQGHEISQKQQANFDTAYKAEVVGKKIDAISLSRVGGASLTTAAFMEALGDIKDDAKA